jgi:hypothetical protein
MSTQRNKSTQTPKANKTTSDKTTQETLRQEPKKQDVKKIQEKFKPGPVDKTIYDRYTALKFLEIALIDSSNEDPSKIKLPDHVKKELTDLEAEIMKCDGVKPIKTMTAAIGHEVIKMVKGVPMPKEYSDIIQNSAKPDYYLG